MSLTKMVVVEFKETEMDIDFALELTNSENSTFPSEMTFDELRVVMGNLEHDIQVSYNEECEGLAELLNQFNLGYVEVDTNADNSGEHDVYMHNFKFENGSMNRNSEGEHLKTYKREESAIKFANSFNMKVSVH